MHPPLFEQAEEQWDLDRLYADLSRAKAQIAPHKRTDLTEVERTYLRGLLLELSPAEIAKERYTAAKTVEVALSQGIYRYAEVLTDRDHSALESWRDIASWLGEAGYRLVRVSINQEQMPEAPVLYGRQAELEQLETWALEESACRLIAINGPAGIGKTSLAIAFARQARPHFDGLIWQSLRYKPSLENLLNHWISQLPIESLGYSKETYQSAPWYDQLSGIMAYLRKHRCLIILDNFETILSSGSILGSYEAGFEAYEELLKRINEEAHQSCVVVTSRESNRDTRHPRAARRLELVGLDYEAANLILEAENLSEKTYWKTLVQQYRGNPLMLQIVSGTIRDLFDGSVRAFLKQGKTLISDMRYVLDQQYQRFSEEEKAVFCLLAQQTGPVPIEQIDHPQNLQAISALLLQRFFVEKSEAGFALRPLAMEYARQVCSSVTSIATR